MAMGDTEFLSRVWPDMCAAYRNGALASACLSVQEAFDVDVPLLLVLCLADRAGHTLSQEDMAALADSAGGWRDAVIAPLRGARQAMKDRFTAPAERALREQIKRLELEAERQHVQRLVDGFPPAQGNGVASAPRYLGSCGLTADAAMDFIEIFAVAAAAPTNRAAAPN